MSTYCSDHALTLPETNVICQFFVAPEVPILVELMLTFGKNYRVLHTKASWSSLV